MDAISEASLDATGQAEEDLNNLFLQASWVFVGIDGELNEVGPGKMNDDESMCRMNASMYRIKLSGIEWYIASAGRNIPDRDQIFAPKTQAEQRCAAKCGIQCEDC